MPVSNYQKNLHLFWRAGFGPMPEDLPGIRKGTPKQFVEAFFKASTKTPAYIDVADSALKGLVMGVGEEGKKQRQLTEEQRKKLRDQSRDDIKSLNLTWLDQMVNSDQQLREKMAFFWHGHFASRNLNILYQQQLLDILRRNALGSFATMLREVSKSAAMINFLNNNQNRKDHPNENFAREVMELFTLGRGNYTENDVKEAARAFTGWGVNLSGEFAFRKFQHDTGNKTVLGRTGNLDGDAVLNILLEEKTTATYIAKKIYRFFVNDKPDAAKVAWLGNRFYESNYDIGQLMRDIFSSDWFYDPINIGCHIKSPVELIAGIQRMLPMKLGNTEAPLVLQRLLGQMLFYPPNVAGWPGGENWIDSSSLMLRLRLPIMLAESEALALQPKDDDDQMMGMKNAPKAGNKGKLGGQSIGAEIDWPVYNNKFDAIPREELVKTISQTLLNVPANFDVKNFANYIDSGSREQFIRTVTIRLMSTPEYQMC